ncbi:hypothetical protein L798_06081 [Zootermopsis nevadensis]|uniref:IGFBP N-terminal domain-containing protein n=1 Tax=Zootermopsis nevadensis TaxID=136037 RepID=A0A067RGE8_ZOONE|nr:hypothetical protein L798_06081 [Zootermopsis nevadensis]
MKNTQTVPGCLTLPYTSQMTLQLLVLGACLSVVSPFVCLQNYCQTVNCTTVTELPCAQNAILVPNSSFCGCCAKCITQLNEGDECAVLLLLGGPPPTVQCRDPLSCINGTCQM